MVARKSTFASTAAGTFASALHGDTSAFLRRTRVPNLRHVAQALPECASASKLLALLPVANSGMTFFQARSLWRRHPNSRSSRRNDRQRCDRRSKYRSRVRKIQSYPVLVCLNARALDALSFRRKTARIFRSCRCNRVKQPNPVSSLFPAHQRGLSRIVSAFFLRELLGGSQSAAPSSFAYIHAAIISWRCAPLRLYRSGDDRHRISLSVRSRRARTGICGVAARMGSYVIEAKADQAACWHLPIIGADPARPTGTRATTLTTPPMWSTTCWMKFDRSWPAAVNRIAR